MNASGWVLLLLAFLQGPPSASAPQGRPGTLNLLGARLSANSVRVGEVFDLTITARIAGDHVVFFPDTLEAQNAIESAGPARPALRSIEGDSMELTLVYPLRAFAIGSLNLPQVDVFLQRAEAREAGTAPRGGPTVQVGEWAMLARAVPGGFTRRPIVPGSIRVEPVLPLASPAGGFVPREPADVIGRSWGVPVLALLGLAGTTLLLAFGMATAWGLRAVRALPPRLKRTPVARAPQLTPRQRAIAELEEIRSSGLHTSGRMDEFYTRSTRVARRYLEVLHPSLGPWLTDRELVEGLTSIAGAADGVHPVRSVFRHAEVVRFGVHVPRPDDAEGDLETLRRWVAQYPTEHGTS